MESVRFFLIDCSDSMFEERPFEDSKLSRARWIAKYVAKLLFHGFPFSNYSVCFFSNNKVNFWINCLKTSQIFSTFNNIDELEKAIYQEMELMRGESSINQALQYVFSKVQKILEENSLLESTQLNFETGDDAVFPELFCVLFSDGKCREKIINPFNNYVYKEYMLNLLITVYIGKNKDWGYSQLKEMSGNCFMHNDEIQVIDFDNYSVEDFYNLAFRLVDPCRIGFCNKCINHKK